MNRFELSALNEDIRRDPAEFIAQCDERYNLMILDTATQVARNRKKSPIVLLAGPSGSGKTTTALRIRSALEARGIGSHSISLDDYYRNPHSEGYPFNFKIPDRDPTGARPLQLGPDEVVVFEGLHALNPLFTDRHPDAFGIYVSTATDLFDRGQLLLRHDTFRLLRRCVRDLYHRNAPALETLTLWDNVCRGEARYITPYRDLADVALNTSLGYEVPVLARVAEPQFFDLPDDAPHMDLVLAAQRAADRFEPISPSLVPKTSLLREEFML